MKTEHLESLLLDRELGELSPAATALLEDYLATHPATTEGAAGLTATVHLARRALATPPAAAAPRPLDLRALERAERAAQPILFRPELYRLAACLALGLGLGWFARQSPSPTGASTLPAQPTSSLVATPAEPRSNFWSVARLTASQRLPAAAGASSRRPFR
jgi:anti-sigma factor RsiW